MTIHLSVDDNLTGIVRAFCGWRVAVRHTSDNWHDVTCSLCMGRRAGLAVQAVREVTAEQLTTPDHPSSTSPTTSPKEPNMNISECFPSLYLKAADLQGRDVVVTIVKVGFEAVGHTREMKAILYFVGKTKGLVCNKTCAKKLTEIAGSPMTEDWTGVAVCLYPTETEFNGEMVDCIRVKPVGKPVMRMTNNTPPPLPAPEPALPVIQIRDEEIPF